jgi:hypothetical protein
MRAKVSVCENSRPSPAPNTDPLIFYPTFHFVLRFFRTYNESLFLYLVRDITAEAALHRGNFIGSEEAGAAVVADKREPKGKKRERSFDTMTAPLHNKYALRKTTLKDRPLLLTFVTRLSNNRIISKYMPSFIEFMYLLICQYDQYNFLRKKSEISDI